MKVTNKHVYGDQEYLATLKQEYTDLGFDTELTNGHLIVYTIRRKKVKVEDKGRKR